MGDRDDPIALSSDDEAGTLPTYLARHVELGFTTDDLDALLKSIESSQARSQDSNVPHLPAEILLLILEFIPVDYVLEFRRVCRAFRDTIDTKVLHSYLPRTELIGCASTMFFNRSDTPFASTVRDVEDIRFMRAHFREMDDTEHTQGGKWNIKKAIFRIEDRWFKNFKRLGGILDAHGSWDPHLDRLLTRRAMRGDLRYCGILTWCIRLDHSVSDLEYSVQHAPSLYSVDLHQRSVSVLWQEVLKACVRSETMIRKRMEQTQSSVFTFGHQEDCVRATRRAKLLANIQQDGLEAPRYTWGLKNALKPLFGKRQYATVGSQFATFQAVEDDATQNLMLLRKEAAMTANQLQRLKQLHVDYTTMVQEGQAVAALIDMWQSAVYHDGPSFRREYREPELSINPLDWSDEVVGSVSQRVMAWKSQQATIKQLKTLLETSTCHLEATRAITDDEDELED